MIEAFEGGAVARSGQTKVIFAPTLGAPEGTVDILTDDGERIRTVVLGLSYFDPVSGDDVVLSEVNPDVVGEILPPNRVIYRNAFTDIDADVIYEYNRDRFSQNIVLHESPADPSVFGLTKLSRLEVLSEILEAPKPVKEIRVVKELAKDLKERSEMAEPDLIDETIRFGESSIGEGKAFDLGDRTGTEAIVTKRWIEFGDRTILFEGVEFESAKEALGNLPIGERLEVRPRADAEGNTQRGLRTIPARQFAQMDSSEVSPLQVASVVEAIEPGYLIDYELVNGSITDYVFKTGVTYLIDGRVYCYGTTTIEGGAVIKYNPYSSGNEHYLDVRGPIKCQTQPYLPAVFTARDDDSVGEGISQGTLTGYYAYEAIRLGTLTSGNRLEHLRVKHALLGVSPVNGNGAHLSHIQFVNCRTAIGVDGTDATVENVIVADSEHRAFWGRNATIAGSNLTIHDTAALWLDLIPSSSTLSLTNSLLTEVVSVISYTGQGASHNVELSSATGVFQSAGGGHFYLANNSPYRDLGTSQIDPGLATELSGRTTFPPTVLAAGYELTENTQWSPHIDRDVGAPDIGYHYSAIDYLVNTCYVTPGVELKVNPGTAIATYGEFPTGIYSHLMSQDNSSLVMEGTVLEPVIFTGHRTIHESVNGSPLPSLRPHPDDPQSYSGQDEIVLRYVEFSTLAKTSTFSGSLYSSYFMNGIGMWPSLIEISDCHFSNFTVDLRTNWGSLLRFNHNAVVGSGWVGFHSNTEIECDNNHIRCSSVWFDVSMWPSLGVTYSIRDNVFESVGWVNFNWQLPLQTFWNAASNAHVDSCCSNLSSTDIRITGGFDFSPGPFGSFYQPNNGGNPLIDAGSRTGSVAGFYHHTSLDDETPELNSLIEIGLHYPAVGGDGRLLDTDGDGVANIFEDLDGDSVVDSNETDWQSSENGTTGVAGLQIFTRLE